MAGDGGKRWRVAYIGTESFLVSVDSLVRAIINKRYETWGQKKGGAIGQIFRRIYGRVCTTL